MPQRFFAHLRTFLCIACTRIGASMRQETRSHASWAENTLSSKQGHPSFLVLPLLSRTNCLLA